MVQEHSLLTALLMTTLAGLSTGLRGVRARWRRPGAPAGSLALGFAGGVMLSVSLADLLPAGLAYYQSVFVSDFAAGCAAASLLLCGMALAGLLSQCLPEEGEGLSRLLGGAEGAAAAEPERLPASARRLRAQALHCGLAVGLALLLHNLPEGILPLNTGVANTPTAQRHTHAIAKHNLPDAHTAAPPLWYATRSRAKSAGAAFLSGLAEPAGALLAYFILHERLNAGLLNGLTLLVAGVMCWVSAAELLFGGFSMEQKMPTTVGFALGVCTMTLGIAALA